MVEVLVKPIQKIIIAITIGSLLVSCGSFGKSRGETVGSVSKKRVKVNEDVPVKSSRTKAISQYKKNSQRKS